MTPSDHFSFDSEAYRQNRPRYPEEIFEWIADASPDTEIVWDCACGNGQATVPLAKRFTRVIGTDSSESQIQAAEATDNIEYRVGPVEESNLDSKSISAVTCAQAAHWFDHDRYHAEVSRVLKPGGLLVVWSYGVHTINEPIDLVVNRLYKDITGPYWPARRKIVEDGYIDLPFPFERIQTPELEIVSDWNLEEFCGYLGTWSGLNYYRQENGIDPRELVMDDLARAWGEQDQRYKVRFPLAIIAGFSPT